MNRKMYWGVALLILLLGTAFVFITVRDRAEIRELEKGLAEAEKLEEESNKVQQPVAKTDSKPPDEQGFKWVRHNDHWEKVPITGAEQKPDPVQQPMNAYKNNGEYIEIDYSVFDGDPKELIRRHADIVLNREKYSPHEYDKALQESSILSRKMLDGYYGKGEYYEELWKFKDEVFTNPLLAKRGLSVSKLQQMIRGEIPPMVVPIDPAVLDAAIDGGDK